MVSAVALLAIPAGLAAQQPLQVRTSFVYEAYEFDPGLSFNRVSEFTIPVAITYTVGRFGNVTLSTGFTSVELRSANPGLLADQTLSGVMDTEARLSVNVVPGRVVALLTGAVPTGIKTVAFDELAILGAISSDIIGFSASNLGTGGNVGGGFAAAFPIGRFALGLGATYRQPLEYQPVLGRSDRLLPGGEFRVRGGLEGAIATRTYVRFAGIFARRSKDEIDAVVQNGVGNRFIGYLSLNQGVGPASLTVYAFDVFRGNPQIESTVAGAAVLPRGNLFVTGTQFSYPVRPTTNVVPRVEFRTSQAVPLTGGSGMRRLGSSWRLGLDVRHRASRRFSLVLQGGAVLGTVVQGQNIDFSGYRAALHLEVR